MRKTAMRQARCRRLTRNHTGDAAVLRYPARSGSCSISAGNTAASTICCRVTLVERRAPRSASQLSRSCAREVCRRTTSRSPIRREANCEVPPCSLPEHLRIKVQVEAVSFFERASGVTDLAQVRYLKTERQGSGAAEHPSHWIATIQYAYGAPSRDPRVRRWNPLGFKVLELSTEPEALPEPAASKPALAGQ